MSGDGELSDRSSVASGALSADDESQSNSQHSEIADNGQQVLRRSDRDKKLSVKAKESKTIELFALLVKEIDKHSDVNEKFVDSLFRVSSSEIESFIEDFDKQVHAITVIYNDLKSINDDVVEREHEDLFSQYMEDIRVVREQINQHEKEEERRLMEEERALEEARAKLEEDMRLYQEKRQRRLQKYKQHSTNPATTSMEEPDKAVEVNLPTTEATVDVPTRSTPMVLDSIPATSSRSQSHQHPGSEEIIDLGQSSIASDSPKANANWMRYFTDNLVGSVGKVKSTKSVEPSIFSGDMLEFADWEVDFDSFVDNEGLTEKEALRFLKKFVSDDAKRCIDGYFITNTAEAYREARSKLKGRYGNRHNIARTFRKKLTDWPPMKGRDGINLRAFGDLLSHICSAMKSTPGLYILNDCEENEKLTSKLPDAQQMSWARRVAKVQEEEFRYPNFQEFTDFVVGEAQVLLLPIVQNRPGREQNKRAGHHVKNFQAGAEASTPQRSKMFCFSCNKDNHYTAECSTLLRKPYKERVDFVRNQQLCFACLKKNHQSKDCRRKANCNTCNKSHPTVLHNADWKGMAAKKDEEGKAQSRRKENSSAESTKQTSKPEESKIEKTETTSKNEANVHSITSKRQMYSMIVPVYVSAVDGGKEKLIYAMLDTQSDASFITTPVASMIEAKGKEEDLTLCTMNGEITKKTNKFTNLKIRGYMTDNETVLQAYEQESIKYNREQIPTDLRCKKLAHLRKIAQDLPPMLDIPVGMLIGVDCPEALTPYNSIPGKPGETFAVLTMFGWTLCGGRNFDLGTETRFSHKTDTELFTMIGQEFSDTGGTPVSQNDLTFTKTLTDGVTQEEDGTYVMPLPFKKEPLLPFNRAQAEKRLEQLKKKLTSDSEYKEEYFNFMNELFKNGHAEEVIESTHSKDKKCWYIPHFGVRHPRKRKLRVVFDASATYNNQSLNDLLLPGPPHINDLLGILCRFRKEPIALTCDVEKMFYNFKVSPEHRDFLRFLWYDSEMNEMKTYRMTVHLFGATSSPGVATFGLRKLAKDHAEISPTASEFLLRDFYVDDGITSVDNIDTAKQLVKDARLICGKGNLRLHKFVCNRPEVLDDLPQSERAVQSDIFADTIPTHRTLGVEWCLASDSLKFTSNLQAKPYTKKGVLSTIAQMYDPIGLISPFALRGKNILQETCREKLPWNESLSDDLAAKWTNWLTQLQDVHKLEIKRCLKPDNFGEIVTSEIHHFSDASDQGYGACSYLRLVNAKNQVYCSLLLSKSRVAPLKKITIARMELQAAIVATKLSKKLQEELKMHIDKEHFWCDSKIVLGYISNEARRFHTYVANRVQQIRNASEPDQWHCVPTMINPADLASRGATITELLDSRWFQGPQFLWEPTVNAELLKTVKPTLDPTDPEVKTAAKVMKTTTIETLNLKSFSDWNKLVKAVTIAKLICRHKQWRRHSYTATDLEETELALIKMDQERYFNKEIQSLKNGEEVSKKSDISRLTPFLDEAGILRIGSRAVKSSTLTINEKKPAIVAKGSHLAKLLVASFHQKVKHQGRLFTQAALRQAGYWVINAHTLIRSHLQKCVTCRLLRGKHAMQQMGQLPTERVEPSPPFTHVGVDTFGPFVVKERRSELKRWCLVFTCMYSRAVHIEVVNDLTTDAFLKALKRLQSIRGPVKTIFSDAGTNFMGAKSFIDKELLQVTQLELKQKLCI